MKKKDRQAYIQAIKPLLSEKRFEHSLNVAQEAVKLAKKYGADPEKAEAAGILHDILKDTPADKQLKIISDFGIIMNDVELSVKKAGTRSAGPPTSAAFCGWRMRKSSTPCATTRRGGTI